MKYRIMLLVVGAIGLGLSCSDPTSVNFFAPLEGTVQVVFVNETPDNISTFWGTYNPLDAQHGVVVKPLTLSGGGQSRQPSTVTTTRNLDVAGADLRRAAEIGRPAGITPSAITDNVTFTNPDNSTAGTAPPGKFLLGIDYSGKDFIEIHFQQVPGTTDQFRVVMKSTTPTPTVAP